MRVRSAQGRSKPPLERGRGPENDKWPKSKLQTPRTWGLSDCREEEESTPKQTSLIRREGKRAVRKPQFSRIPNSVALISPFGMAKVSKTCFIYFRCFFIIPSYYYYFFLRPKWKQIALKRRSNSLRNADNHHNNDDDWRLLGRSEIVAGIEGIRLITKCKCNKNESRELAICLHFNLI